MLNWKNGTITSDSTIEDAVKAIDKSGLMAAFVVDLASKLIGIVTDGDIRRAILNHTALDTNVEKIMTTSPIVARTCDSKEQVTAMMKKHKHVTIPIVDENNRLVGVETLHHLVQTPQHNNTVILMAGGLGQRLRPLTDDCPKPLLKIGDRPLLAITIDQFIAHGFTNFLISINFKGQMVKDYFGDGKNLGVNINYIEETKQLGTAGSLSLIQKPDEPVIVMNGDVLTQINPEHLLDFHASQKAKATMCVREYEHQIPYGVVNIKNHNLTSLIEKPITKAFVNAGIYVLEPSALDSLRTNSSCDMTDLFDRLLADKQQISVFPIREYWLDIGRMEDFEEAHNAYYELFN